jgi:hypothetical protein
MGPSPRSSSAAGSRAGVRGQLSGRYTSREDRYLTAISGIERARHSQRRFAFRRHLSARNAMEGSTAMAGKSR